MTEQSFGFAELTEWLHKSKRPIDIDTGTLLFCVHIGTDMPSMRVTIFLRFVHCRRAAVMSNKTSFELI